MKTWTAAEIRGLGVVVGIVTAGEILGIGRSNSYTLARRGAFPVPVLKIGGRYRVRTADLVTFLRLDMNPTPAA